MIASSLVFVGTLWGLRQVDHLGTESALIYSSCAAMLVRIGYAYTHASRKIGETGGLLVVTDILPKATTAVVSVVCGTGLRFLYNTGRWKTSWRGWAELVGSGGVLGVAMLVIM
jgi:oligosaccharide translocation protein RFT1